MYRTYLCVKIVRVNPSAPTDRALQSIGLILCRTIAQTPHTFTTSVCHRSNTGSVGAREGTRGRTERGEEMLLVIVRRADMVDQVVADVLCAERTPSRLFCSMSSFLKYLSGPCCVYAASSMGSYRSKSSDIQSRTRVSTPGSARGQRWLASRWNSGPHQPLRQARERSHRSRP